MDNEIEDLYIALLKPSAGYKWRKTKYYKTGEIYIYTSWLYSSFRIFKLDPDKKG